MLLRVKFNSTVYLPRYLCDRTAIFLPSRTCFLYPIFFSCLLVLCFGNLSITSGVQRSSGERILSQYQKLQDRYVSFKIKNYLLGPEDEVFRDLKYLGVRESFKAGGNFRGRFHQVLQHFSVLTPLEIIKLPFNLL